MKEILTMIQLVCLVFLMWVLIPTPTIGQVILFIVLEVIFGASAYLDGRIKR